MINQIIDRPSNMKVSLVVYLLLDNIFNVFYRFISQKNLQKNQNNGSFYIWETNYLANSYAHKMISPTKNAHRNHINESLECWTWLSTQLQPAVGLGDWTFWNYYLMILRLPFSLEKPPTVTINTLSSNKHNQKNQQKQEQNKCGDKKNAKTDT